MVKRKPTKLKMRKRQRKLKEAIHPNEVPLLVLKVHLHSLTLTAHWCCSRAARALEQGKYCMCLCLSDLSERKQISLVKTFNFLILYLGMVLGSLAKPIMKMTAKWVSFYDQVHLDGVSQPQACESHRDFGLRIHRLIIIDLFCSLLQQKTRMGFPWPRTIAITAASNWRAPHSHHTSRWAAPQAKVFLQPCSVHLRPASSDPVSSAQPPRLAPFF